MNAKVIMGVVFMMAFVGWMSTQLGVAAPIFELPGIEGYGFWDRIVDVILGPVNVGMAFMGFIGFTLSDEVPAVVNYLVFIPIGFGVLWLTVSLIRGVT